MKIIFLIFCVSGLALSIPMFFALKSLGNIGTPDCYCPPALRKKS